MKHLLNPAFVGYEEFCRSRRVLATSAEGQSFKMSSLSECIPWMTVGLVKSVAIVTLNRCTIIVFMRNRNLRKRSTYLVINLAVIDMFVGGAVLFNLFYRPGVLCNLFKCHVIEYWTIIFKKYSWLCSPLLL